MSQSLIKVKEIYDEAFYRTRHKDTLHSAETILQLVQNAIPQINSAVEFGCGVGTWLYVLKERGTKEILGFDGPWVPPEFRVIPQENFIASDFEKPVRTEKRYDLAISLEVAEHISPPNARQFVESITNASDYVLFSAAIPEQGGIAHINEQWPEYWENLFFKKDYICCDIIREKIWNDDKIPAWYRQNVLLFMKAKNTSPQRVIPFPLVHPDIFLRIAKENTALRNKLYKRLLDKIYARFFKNS